MAKILFVLVFVVILQPVFGQIIPCPKTPKIPRIPLKFVIFNDHPQKAQIFVSNDTIKKYSKQPSGEQKAFGDTTRKQKNHIAIGQANRIIDLQDSTHVFRRRIKLTIFDYAYVDGDNITLFQDGKKIVKTYVKSPKTPTIVTVRISRRRPTIIEMLANNLGRILPNTAMIEVNDGNTIKKIALFSNIKESGAFKVTYSKTKIKKKPERIQYPKFSKT